MPQRQGTKPLGNLYGKNVPAAVAVTVATHCAEGVAGIIGAERLRNQINTAAAVHNAFVELNVLIAHKPLVEQSVLLKNRPFVAAKRHSINHLHIGHASAEIGIANAKPTAQYRFDCQRFRRF